MKTAAAYLRVSTERQDEYSLDSQLKLIREFANKHDYIVPDEFVFVDDGISGRSAKKRTQFQNMIAFAKDKSHPFEAVLVWKFSRFARNQEESIVYKSLLQHSGVSVISISEPIIEGPFGSLIERILEWMDEFYSIRLSAEVKRGMNEKFSRGEPLSLPSYGYSSKDKQYIVVPEEAAVVRRIYEEYVSGKGMTEITRRLAAEGVLTRRGNIPDNRWVKYILGNPVYIGKLRWSTEGKVHYSRANETDKGLLTDGTHEHIIDDALWQKAQERLAFLKRSGRKYVRRDQPVEWMLKGLVRCSSCGSTLVYTALSCPSMQCHKYARGQCRVSHSLSIAKANRLVIAALESNLLTGSFAFAPEAAISEKKGPDYGKLIGAEKLKLERVYRAYEIGVDTIEEYARKKKAILAQIAQYEAEQSKPQAVSADPELLKARLASVLAVLKSDASEQAKNAALSSVVSYIIYNKTAQTLTIFYYI